MKNISEETVCHLAMSPFYVVHLVLSECLEPEKISERHIVRAIEYGLTWQTPFSEGIFELLRSNLHKYYAKFSPDYRSGSIEDLRAALCSVRQTLDQLVGPPEMIDDFKACLKNLAVFVAGGGTFRKEIEHAGMQTQAEWIKQTLI